MTILASLSGGLFFLALLGVAFLLMLLLPRLTMGKALFSSLCCMLFVSYAGFVFLDNLRPMAYALIGGGLALAAAGFVLMALDLRGLRQRVLFSVSFWGYLLLCGVMIVLTYGHIINEHDAFSFWARAVKELFMADSAYFRAGINMFHMDYMPMAASLQYCIVRVLGWQDAFLLYVPIACVLTSICAVADMIPKKRYAAVLVALAFLYYPTLRFHFGMLTADGPLSMVFVCALLCLCYREDAGLAALFPTLCAAAILPGLKIYSGLLFAVLLLALMLLGARKAAAAKKGDAIPEGDARPARIPFRFAAVACCLVLFTQCSWSGYYHFRARQMEYENKQYEAAYLGKAADESQSPPVFEISDLLRGNHRTGELSTSLTAEKWSEVTGLIYRTLSMYKNSTLPYALLFFIPLLWIALRVKGKERARVWTVAFSLMAAGIIYTLGFFAGFFVQAEIYGGSLNYLSTVHLPVMIAAMMVCLYTLSCQRNMPGKGAVFAGTALLLAAPLLLLPGHWPTPNFQPAAYPEGYAQYTKSFWDEDAAPVLSEADQQGRVVLMDAAWEASQVGSRSGITHTYQYFALPLRVWVYQFDYDNDAFARSITREFMEHAVVSHKSNLLILRADEGIYKEAFASALDLETDVPMPWVFDVDPKGETVTFTLRIPPED